MYNLEIGKTVLIIWIYIEIDVLYTHKASFPLVCKIFNSNTTDLSSFEPRHEKTNFCICENKDAESAAQ